MRRRACALLVLALAAACVDEGPIAGPGTMTATVLSPNGDEGAAVVTLLADDVGAITPVGTTEVAAFAGAGSTQLVLISPDGGTLSFQVAVADTTQPPAFTIDEVAGPDDELRPSLAGYGLAFVR